MSKSSRFDGLDDCARKVSVCGYKRRPAGRLKLGHNQATNSTGRIPGISYLAAHAPVRGMNIPISQVPVQSVRPKLGRSALGFG